ncbi:MAG: tetratricopeptide repeat protein [Planctomycetia bacterium]
MTPPRILSPRFRASAALVALCCAGCGGLGRGDNAKGVALYQQGNYRGAANHFQQALARQPGNPDCFYNLGATYHQQAKVFHNPADLQVAEQYYHLCLARNPDHEACQRALAVLLVEEDRRDDAVAQLRAWSQRQPYDPDPHIELARLSQEQGDLAQAEKELVAAVTVAPNDPRALVALGALREASCDQAQALASYSRALAVNPSQPVVAAKVATLQQAQAPYRTAAAPPVMAAPVPFGGGPPPAQVAPGPTPGPFGTVAR